MYFNKINRSKIAESWMIILLILLCSFSPGLAQDAVEKKTPVIDIKYFNLNSDSFFVRISSIYKDDKVFPIENQNIKLFFNEAIENNFLGLTTTDINGNGLIQLPKKFKGMIDTFTTFDLVAASDENLKFETGSGSATIENTFLELQTFIEDSIKTIRVFAFAKGNEVKTPLSGVEISFFIKKMVGLFPISEESVVTDSSGMAELEYTIEDMPGDSLGTLIIGARFTDDDTYGNTMSYMKTLWGIKTSAKDNFSSVRALWATANRVPIWLLFLASVIIFIVWGSIFYITFQVYKIYKIGKKQKNNT